MQAPTLPRKRLPAAWAVLAVALALLFVLVSAISLIAWNSYRDTVERARARSAAAAQIASTQIEWLIVAGRQLAEEADHVIGNGIGTIGPDAAAEFALHLKHMPEGVSLSLTDENGKMIYSAGGEAAELGEEAGLSTSDLTAQRPWYVSAMVREDTSGAASFLLAHRIVRGGKMVGAAVVRIPVEIMFSVWRSLDLGPGSTVGLLRDDGWQVARYPPMRKAMNLSKYVLFTDYLKRSPSGVYSAASPIDGELRIVGYRKVPNAPLIAVASISRRVAMERLASQMEQLALFLLPILAGLAALAVWVVRLLRRDEQMRANLAAAVERNNLLLREIHHRTKNNLQSVASLLKLQPISEEAKAAMTARIAAMSALHEQAYRSDQFSEVNLHDYLLALADSIRKSGAEGVVIGTELAHSVIDRDLAQPLGLIVNEVISNAMKHAFSDRKEGHIALRLRQETPETAELVIEDDGPGFIPTGEEAGMGGRLIRAFAQQLGNDYSYTSDGGTRFSIRFPARPVPEE